MKVQELVLAEIRATPGLTAGEIAGRLGFAREVVDAALRRLVIGNLVYKLSVGPKWCWHARRFAADCMFHDSAPDDSAAPAAGVATKAPASRPSAPPAAAGDIRVTPRGVQPHDGEAP